MAESRTEDLFIDLIKGTTTDFEPQSRFESYMKCIINKADPAETPKPESRKDVLMKTYAEQVYNGGGSGAGIDTLTDVNLTASGTTVAYDIASGVTVSSNGKFTYEGGEKEATTKVNVPIVAGKGIIIDKVADKEQVEAKVDIADAVSMNDASHRGNIYIPFKQGTNDYSIGIGSKPASDDNSGIQIGSSSFARQKGVAVGGYAKCGCVGVAIGFSIENKYNSSNPSEQNGKVTVGAYLTNDTDGCIVLGTGNEKTTAEDRFILADGNGYNLNQRHTYFKIIKETVDNVAKYTAYLNDKKLLTEDDGIKYRLLETITEKSFDTYVYIEYTVDLAALRHYLIHIWAGNASFYIPFDIIKNNSNGFQQSGSFIMNYNNTVLLCEVNVDLTHKHIGLAFYNMQGQNMSETISAILTKFEIYELK